MAISRKRRSASPTSSVVAEFPPRNQPEVVSKGAAEGDGLCARYQTAIRSSRDPSIMHNSNGPPAAMYRMGDTAGPRFARQQSIIQLLWLACRSFLGFLNHTIDLRMFTVPTVEISSHHRRLLVAFDGEIEMIRSPLQYRVRPGVLPVFAPAAADA